MFHFFLDLITPSSQPNFFLKTSKFILTNCSKNEKAMKFLTNSNKLKNYPQCNKKKFTKQSIRRLKTSPKAVKLCFNAVNS